MEAAYLHFNITNMITIWIMAAIGLALLGLVSSTIKNKSNS
jgi:hypothetical protein